MMWKMDLNIVRKKNVIFPSKSFEDLEDLPPHPPSPPVQENILKERRL